MDRRAELPYNQPLALPESDLYTPSTHTAFSAFPALHQPTTSPTRYIQLPTNSRKITHNMHPHRPRFRLRAHPIRPYRRADVQRKLHQIRDGRLYPMKSKKGPTAITALDRRDVRDPGRARMRGWKGMFSMVQMGGRDRRV